MDLFVGLIAYKAIHFNLHRVLKYGFVNENKKLLCTSYDKSAISIFDYLLQNIECVASMILLISYLFIILYCINTYHDRLTLSDGKEEQMCHICHPADTLFLSSIDRAIVDN